MEVKLYYIDEWYLKKMKRLNTDGRFNYINLNHPIGYIFDMDDDEEKKHQLYCIPFMENELDRLMIDQDVTDKMFPVPKEFLNEFDSSYIEDEQEREKLRNELLKYDDRAKQICSNAKVLYKQGRIKKDAYHNYGKRLKQLEEEAYLVLQRYYRNISNNKSKDITLTFTE